MAVDNMCNALNMIERAPSAHEAARLSPSLPQELLDLIIDHIDTADLKTLQACSLSGRCLRPRAQYAMFTDISFHVGNLTTMNECFRAVPSFAEAVHHLGINAIEIVADYDMLILQNNITLLASCGLRLRDTAIPLRSSSLTSMHISMLSVPSLPDLVDIICAFPCLSDLSCIRVRWGPEGSTRLMIDNFQEREHAPSLKRISIRIGRTSGLLEALFLAEREVVLRSIELDHFDTTSLCWSTLIQRAGLHLKELTMRPFYGEFTQVDLQSNTCLRTLTLHGATIFNAEPVTEALIAGCLDPDFWLFSLLRTITSTQLETIVFMTVRIIWKSETQYVIRCLDDILSSQERFADLRIVDFHPAPDDGRSMMHFRRLARQWMPKLARQGRLFLEGKPFV